MSCPPGWVPENPDRRLKGGVKRDGLAQRNSVGVRPRRAEAVSRLHARAMRQKAQPKVCSNEVQLQNPRERLIEGLARVVVADGLRRKTRL